MRRLLYDARVALESPSRTPRMAVVVGRLLGIAFLLCFGTGLYSHFIQHPADGMFFPNQPYWIYQLNQGIHVTTGIVCIPLILAKLWTVYPNLFGYPAIKDKLAILERGSIAIFIGASIVQLVIGLLNTYQSLVAPFYFLQVHYGLSFVIIGSLAIHIAVKLPIISRYWRKPADGHDGELEAYESLPVTEPAPTAFQGITGRVMSYIDGAPTAPSKVSRRGFLGALGATSAAAVVLTVGQTFEPLAATNAFGPREKGTGPQGVPINRTSKQAKVTDSAMDPNWALAVRNGDQEVSVSRADLAAMQQYDVQLPIACVEGWSQMASWRGVRLSELMAAVGITAANSVRIQSLEEKGAYRETTMDANFVQDPTTLVALQLNGEDLDLEHGYPARIIAPGRPGVLQTKWLATLEVI
ncbi:molybdopterin-dependent oxidoreductase [Naasia lichenicola]|uniref:Twin-arginine translocation signal domain-containing protein n=1 Tax=Naasia lichenicola TaxID=2565933 RepID=A0A4S4FJ81_9MICO|nr:molybdopterin-dependent oxidoreductase [Naasia lichenicola]THG30171.1 twin-arginine translocation signal domain-containing protein [Naasia lichenicola]